MKKYGDKRNWEDGFTLIELMVVIIIFRRVGRVDLFHASWDVPMKRVRPKAKMQIESLESALKLYKLEQWPLSHNGTGPESFSRSAYCRQSAQKLADREAISEKGKVPKDPWNNEYIYVSPGSHGDFDLSSLGTDGEAGGEGVDKDIHNWEIE